MSEMNNKLTIKVPLKFLTLEEQLYEIRRHCPSLNLLQEDGFSTLRAHFMAAFADSNQPEETEEDKFERIYSLVYTLVSANSVQMVHILWIECAQHVLREWCKTRADHFGHCLEYLNYLLNCWHHYQLGINRIKGFMSNAELKLASSSSLLAFTLNPKAKNQLFGELFIHRMLKESDKQVFDALLKTLLLARQLDDASSQPRLANIARNMLKEMFDLLFYLQENDVTKPVPQPVYTRLFVLPYLGWLRDHYLEQAKQHINHSLIHYLDKVFQAIQVEAQVVSYGIRAETIILIEKVIFGALVFDQRHAILNFSRFQECSSSVEHLGVLYRLLKGSDQLLKMFMVNISRLIEEQLEKQYVQFNLKANKPIRAELAMNVVDVYIRLHHTSMEMIDKYFEHNTSIVEEIDKCFGRFFDNKPLLCGIFCLAVHLVSCRFYFTHVRGNNHKDDHEDEKQVRRNYVDRTFALLSLVNEKDQIDCLSRYFLCERILHLLSYDMSEDIESIGSHNLDSSFNARLLFKDWQLLEDKQQSSFTIRLLNSMLWNVADNSNEDDQQVATPPDLLLLYDNFLERFQQEARFRQRVYRLNLGYSTAELEANFAMIDRKFIFQMTTHQVSILRLFNANHHVTLQQAASLTKLDVAVVRQILWTFYRYHLVDAHKTGDEPAVRHVKLNHFGRFFFKINEHFQSSQKKETRDAEVIDWIGIEHIEKLHDVGALLTQVTNWNPCQTDRLQASTQDRKLKQWSSTSIVDDDELPANWVANSNRSTRVQAAIVRFMKRAKMVGSVEQLYQLVYHTTPTPTPSSSHAIVPHVNKKRFEAIVQLLVARQYLRSMHNGNIFYDNT